MSGGETHPMISGHDNVGYYGCSPVVLARGGGELELEEGRGVGGTARYEADREVLLGWKEVDLGLCLECQEELLY